MVDDTLFIAGKTIRYYIIQRVYNLEFDPAVVLREWVIEILELINSDSAYVEFLNNGIEIRLDRVVKLSNKEFEKQIEKAFFERLALNGCEIEISGKKHYIISITKWEGLEVS